MNGRVLSLVERLSRRRDETPRAAQGSGEEGVIVEPYLYGSRVNELQRNAGRIITDAIAQTPERYEDSIRRGLAISLAEDGQPRTQAINFFNMYVAPILAEYADDLEERREYIIRTTFIAARANPLYRGAMITIEATARQVKRDKAWSIENKVREFVTQERWAERYVPIVRKYMN